MNHSINASIDSTNIVFSDAAAGALKQTFHLLDISHHEKILPLVASLAIGSIWQLHRPEGVTKRYESLHNELHMDDDLLAFYENQFHLARAFIEEIPTDRRIVIWVGPNAHEQTACRFVFYLLREKTNEIVLLPVDELYKTTATDSVLDFLPLQVGEVVAEKIAQFYETIDFTTYAVSAELRQYFENDWLQLAEDEQLLRIYKNKEIVAVAINYYDDFLIETAKRLVSYSDVDNFMPALRLIGEAIGQLDQVVGDPFINERIHQLIDDGAFDFRGQLDEMHTYQIKLLQHSPI